MIGYSKYILANGLTVVLHEAWDTPLATVNLLYNVGSRDEDPQRTGFAHLFEHLMFGGTERVPDYDAVVSSLGGENNAFTNTDYTNYYITLPADSLAEALALEADRMEGLRLTPKALEVQQQVVTEEYRQRYMNQPYGDMWLLLRPLCFRSHPYRWATIGADIAHVGEATLQEVMDFHCRFYRADKARSAESGGFGPLDVEFDEIDRASVEQFVDRSAVDRLPSRLVRAAEQGRVAVARREERSRAGCVRESVTEGGYRRAILTIPVGEQTAVVAFVGLDADDLA